MRNDELVTVGPFRRGTRRAPSLFDMVIPRLVLALQDDNSLLGFRLVLSRECKKIEGHTMLRHRASSYDGALSP
jgi:hypothetical protein